MNQTAKIIIIGGGIVGVAIANELAQSESDILLVEKNLTIPGLNQSSTNEGSIHSGIFYPKIIMPLKAKLCVAGSTLLYSFLEKYNLAHKRTGKLIVASNGKEEKILEFFFEVGLENNVPGIELLDKIQVKKIEPNLSNIKKAILVPSCGTAATESLILKLKQLSEIQGVKYALGTKVIEITPQTDKFVIKAEIENIEREYQADIVINSAGLYADEVARFINKNSNYQISAIRGEFASFNIEQSEELKLSGMHIYNPPYFYKTDNNLIETVDIPPEKINSNLKEGKIFVTVGVHLSPAYSKVGDQFRLNKYTISPIKTTGIAKDDYNSGLHPKKDFIEKVSHIFPNLQEDDIQLDHTGIMAPLNGFRDFVIQRDEKFPNFINLIGMESPAWTASLAIAKYVKGLLY